MKTRNGKIARLPIEIREQLNRRLADGEPGNRLVEWLNSNPDVMQVMMEHFEGRPITEGNLSEWRAGGYEEWVTLHAFLDETRVISENAGELADTGISSDHLRIVLLAHHAHLLQNLGIMPEDEYQTRLNTVRKLTTSIMNMIRGELHKARLELQRERLELLREKQNLKSVSASKAAASTSSNACPAASATRHSSPPLVAASTPGARPIADSPRAESAAPPHSDQAPSLTIPIPSGPIHPDSPASHPRHPVSSDSVGLTLPDHSKLAA